MVRRHRQGGVGPLFIVVVVVMWVVGSFYLGASAFGVTVSGATTQTFDVVSGETYDGVVTLRNGTDTDVAVRLYVTDYLFQATGEVFYDPPGSHHRSAGFWVRPATERVVVPAFGTQHVHYRVAIPDDDGLSGTYWAVMMVEPEPTVAQNPLASEPMEAGYRLHTVARYAVQIVLHVGHVGEPRLKVEGARLSFDPDGGGHRFQVDVYNEGDGWVRPNVWMAVYDEAGTEMGVFSAPGHRLYPGTSVRQTVPLSGNWPPGSYAAVLVMDGGGRDVFAARFNLHISDDPPST